MASASGTRLGPYEIVSLIGAGGMGEVYQARDLRLDRLVAIKIIAPNVLDSTEGRDRFEREARAIASLSHPHICTLHDVGSVDGVDFLVMEHLEGETLATRLARQRSGNPLPLDGTLRIATELADALAAAHRAGIVHRDLKPANIMLARSGGSRHIPPHVKVLDFGLARLHAPHGPFEQTATMTAPLTGEGAFVGTLPYMAPEQLEHGAVDARTDLFAFGAIVYEMATGRRAFTGESQASLVAAILDHDPEPLGVVQPAAPPALDRLVRKCLAKNPDARWQSASDVADELRWIAGGSGSTASRWGGTSRPSTRRLSRRAATTVAALVAVAAAIATAWWMQRVQRETAGEPQHTQVTFRGDVGVAAIAPDGRTIAYVAGEPEVEVRVFVRDLAGGQALPIWTGRYVNSLAWLADSTHVAVSGARDKFAVWIVPKMGGAERRVAGGGSLISVSPDGAALIGASQNHHGFFMTPLAGGNAWFVKLAGYRWLMGLTWHPRTNHVVLATQDDDKTSAIWRVTPEGRDQIRLFHSREPIGAICASAAVDAVYALRQRGAAGDLIRVPIANASEDADVLLTGLPIGEEQLFACSVTADSRRFLYARVLTDSNLWRLDLIGAGDPKQLTKGTLSLTLPDVSPDTKWIAATAGPESAAEIVRIPFDGGDAVRLMEGIGPVWSADGRRIAFVSQRSGSPRVWLATGDGVPIAEVKDSAVGNPLLVWLPGGRLAWPTPDARNYVIRDLATGSEERLVRDESLGWVFTPRFSPNGDRVAFYWNRHVKGKPGLWLMTWPGREERFLGEPWMPIGWSADGEWIYASPRAGRTIVRVSAGTGESQPVGTFPIGIPTPFGCALTRDHTSIVCGLTQRISDAWLVSNFDPHVR